MSASKNPDAMNSKQGEFHSRRAPSEPMTTKGHAPGVMVGNDAVPEFHAETHPPGTAPASNTFHPQGVPEVPGGAGENVMPGATSADVHQGIGHPGQGMTSQEMHGGKRTKQGKGQERPEGLSLDDELGARKLDGKPMQVRGDARDTEPVPPEGVASGR